MPIDAVFLSSLYRELKEKTVGGRIDKIQQPERDMIIVSLRANGENLRLLIAAGNGNARIHLTKTAFENPVDAPMFCMLLRKHLTGARILNITQPEHERMLIIDLSVRDELGYESSKKLVVELIGRSSNLILVDSEGRIIDCIRRMDFGGNELRRMLPGMIYRMPPKQSKPALLDLSYEELCSAADSADRSVPAEKWLLSSFAGLSPLVSRELSFRAGGDYSLLPAMLDAFRDSVRAGEMSPYMLQDGRKPVDFCFMRIAQYGEEYSCVKQESFSALLDAFYSERDRYEQQRRRAHDLTKTVRTLRDRQQRKLSNQREELKRTDGREDIRKRAELITANIFRMRKGDRTLVCPDYYEEGCPEITIALDPLKSPQQNSAALFREYRKQQAAKQHLTLLIEDGEKQLDYLNSVLELLSSSESEKDIIDIRRELIQTGFLKLKSAKKQDKGRAQPPMRFITDDGYEVLAGRSNIQNDELSAKIGRRTDYWFHTQKTHGSHVILRCGDSVPTEKSIFQAAVISAYFSQGRESAKVNVDYTMLRNVRKPSGSLPGKVIYTDYKTMTVSPDAELVEKLRK